MLRELEDYAFIPSIRSIDSLVDTALMKYAMRNVSGKWKPELVIENTDKLKDYDKKLSPAFDILVAFSTEKDLPNILGKRGLLDNSKFKFKRDGNWLYLDF